MAALASNIASFCSQTSSQEDNDAGAYDAWISFSHNSSCSHCVVGRFLVPAFGVPPIGKETGNHSVRAHASDFKGWVHIIFAIWCLVDFGGFSALKSVTSDVSNGSITLLKVLLCPSTTTVMANAGIYTPGERRLMLLGVSQVVEESGDYLTSTEDAIRNRATMLLAEVIPSRGLQNTLVCFATKHVHESFVFSLLPSVLLLSPVSDGSVPCAFDLG